MISIITDSYLMSLNLIDYKLSNGVDTVDVDPESLRNIKVHLSKNELNGLRDVVFHKTLEGPNSRP